MNINCKRILVGAFLALITTGLVFGGGQTAGGAATGELTMLRTRHFIDAWEDAWTDLTERFEAENPGVKFRTDLVNIAEYEIKYTAEAEARKGHDMVRMNQGDPILYADSLADLDDVIETLTAQKGEPLALAKEFLVSDGHWKAVASDENNMPSRLLVRLDYWNDVGFSREQIWNLDWDKFLTAAEKLHAIDHPIGMAVSQFRGDTHHWIVPFMWSWGSHIVDENLNVTIDSQNTYAALRYAKELYRYMPPGVIAWDEGGDNRYMLSGVGSGALSNAGSIYSTAVAQNLPFADQLQYAPNPVGPAGQFVEGFLTSFGVWNFSPNIELAKKFLLFYHNPDNQIELLTIQKPVGLPTWKNVKLSFTEPALEAFSPPLPEEIHHSPGWPGPVCRAEVKAYRAAILPVLMGKVFTGMPIQEAIDWADRELEKIYQEEKIERSMRQ